MDRHKHLTRARISRKNPATTDIRAGVVLQHNGKVLIVSHRAHGNNRSNRGVPKGGMVAADKAALDTALRELREETGIDVTLPCFKATISGGEIMVCEPNKSNELHIYFIIQIFAEPTVRLCYRELTAYEWVPVADLPSLNPVSVATSLLLAALSRVDMESKCTAQLVPRLTLE